MKLSLLMISRILAAGALVSAGALSANTIKIAYPNWAEGIAVTHLAKVVHEDEMGYDVELTMADPGAIYAAVADGNQDAFLDGWLPHTHAPYWEEFGDSLVDLGSFPSLVTGSPALLYRPMSRSTASKISRTSAMNSTSALSGLTLARASTATRTA